MTGPGTEDEFVVFKGVFQFDEEIYEALEAVFHRDKFLHATMELARGGPQPYAASVQYTTKYVPYLDRYLWEHGFRFRNGYIELDVDRVQ